MNDFSHLTDNKEEAPQDSLERITNLAVQYKDLKNQHAMAKANEKEAKAAFNKVSMELIPEAMMQAGLTSFELSTGEKVSYKEEVSASVQDYDKLAEFLEARGDDGIIKISIELGKTPQNVINKILSNLADKYGILAEVKQTVHHQTLKSYIGSLCGIKKNTLAEMSIAELGDDKVNVFTYYKTTVK